MWKKKLLNYFFLALLLLYYPVDFFFLKAFVFVPFFSTDIVCMKMNAQEIAYQNEQLKQKLITIHQPGGGTHILFPIYYPHFIFPENSSLLAEILEQERLKGALELKLNMLHQSGHEYLRHHILYHDPYLYNKVYNNRVMHPSMILLTINFINGIRRSQSIR